MENYLKMQLQCMFELELLQNRTLKLVNFFYDYETPLVGEVIINQLEQLENNSDDWLLLQTILGIATNAAKRLLESGAVKNIYTVYCNDDIEDDRQNYPIFMCTDIRMVGDAVNAVDYKYTDVNDPQERQWMQFVLHAYVTYYEDDKIKQLRLY